MPLSKTITAHNNTRIAFWQLTEPTNELTTALTNYIGNTEHTDIQALNNIGSQRRQNEWCAVRLTLTQLLGAYPQIAYLPTGKPYLANITQHLSIAHTSDMVSVALSDNNIAIDIETITDRILKIASRFVLPHDVEHFRHNDYLKALYLQWCAKETMVKLFNRKDFIFAHEIRVECPLIENEGTMTCRIIHKDIQTILPVHYTFFDNIVFTWATQPTS